MLFSKKSGRLSSTGSEILVFGSQCSANFQPIFIPKFKLYEDLENIKTNRVNTVVFNLHEIKQSKLFFGTPGTVQKPCTCARGISVRSPTICVIQSLHKWKRLEWSGQRMRHHHPINCQQCSESLHNKTITSVLANN